MLCKQRPGGGGNHIRLPIDERVHQAALSSEEYRVLFGLRLDELINELLTNRGVNNLLQRLRESSERVFLLTWAGGSRIPRGVQILGQTIQWTQNGIVSDTDGKDIGTYERIRDFEGPANLSIMMIFAFGAKPENSDETP